MTAGTAFLLILWIGSHLSIILTIRDSKFRLPVFAIIGVSLLVAYAMKPYTYDLQSYSIFFHSGYIQTLSWHAPPWKDRHGAFQLDPRDTTGEPFEQGYKVGFRLFAKAGNMLFPTRSLVPRFDSDESYFEERGPPRSDAMVFLVMVFGFIPLYIGAKRFVHTKVNNSNGELVRMITAGPIIFGSVFFLLGSQNSLRQFLGVSIIVLALSMLSSRRYVTCLVLVLLSSTFHKWAPILGVIVVSLFIIGVKISSNRYIPKIGTFHFSSAEVLSLMLGVSVVILIKGVMILGIFNAAIPFLEDLKPYLIMDDQYESAERMSTFVKVGAVVALFVCTEILLGRKSNSDIMDIRSLRRLTLVFIVPLAIYPEIFSRLLILYWAIELVFVVWGVSSNDARPRYAAAVVFVSYGLAPNAINVLIGPNWLQSL